ncbi:hypothetical protein, partial [Escherichia coli]|uniref:hypothetical protein n=1 Tax=Escherichia coli TaxID=562 RepID=UPI0028623F91
HLQNKWVLKLQDPGFGTRRYSDDAYYWYANAWNYLTCCYGAVKLLAADNVKRFQTAPKCKINHR